MKAIIIFVFSLLFMYLDFLFAEFSPVMVSGLEVYFVPRLLLMYVLLISIYVSPSMSAFIGIVTGLMLDVYTGSVYGVHAFGMWRSLLSCIRHSVCSIRISLRWPSSSCCSLSCTKHTSISSTGCWI